MSLLGDPRFLLGLILRFGLLVLWPYSKESLGDSGRICSPLGLPLSDLIGLTRSDLLGLVPLSDLLGLILLDLLGLPPLSDLRGLTPL